MIREILNGEFMDYRNVHEKCSGLTRSEIRYQKMMEGIKTLSVTNKDGETIWLWYDPQDIWEKYSA